jgi:gas vesicle protein
VKADPTPETVRDTYQIEETDVSKLRRMKQQAIKDLDYDKSKGIQILINSLTCDNSDGLIAAFKDWLGQVLTQTLQRLDENIAALDDRTARRTSEFKSDIETVMAQMKERHLRTLTELESDRAETIARIDSRESAEYKNAVAVTQLLAADDQADLAKRMLKDAADGLEQEKQALRDAANSKYDTAVQGEVKKQKLEFVLLKSSFDEHMKLIDLAYDNDAGTERRKAAIFVQRTLLKGINDCCSGLKAVKYRTRVTQELTNYVRDFLEAQQKVYLLAVE